ncbi:MAG TPA: L,D-transpeptidase, partial [Labilithrix sp.]
MTKKTIFALSAILAVLATAPACSSDPGETVDQGEDDLLKKTAATSSWSYHGLVPRLDSPAITVSIAGKTAHVTGLLPTSFTGKLPFHARTETVGTRTRVHLAYPIATVDPNGHLPDGTTTRNPEPFTYATCGGDMAHATNAIGDFGGFPFIEYICGHRDADGRVRSGIAFHGPISDSHFGGADYWVLRRGAVSHACNRMLGEHVLELAHAIGFDAGARGTPVKVIADFDTLAGQPLDVDYPATGWTRPS